jgi:uroporphyrinogen-III decarboxylase
LGASRGGTTLAKRAGVPMIRIHDQRHTYTTLGLSTGASLKSLSESMGHAQTSITINTYAHALPHQRREVADKVGDVLNRNGARPGHVFNLGHGVLPETPPDTLRRVVEMVHQEGQAHG